MRAKDGRRMHTSRTKRSSLRVNLEGARRIRPTEEYCIPSCTFTREGRRPYPEERGT